MGDPIINTQVDAINATLGNIKVDLAALRPSIRAIKDAIAETYLTDTIENVPIASFSDGADDIPVRELQVAIEPVQSLNGQTSPYPAGGGKNKCPKTSQTSRTWNGLTVTVNNDGSVKMVGTTSVAASFDLIAYNAGQPLFYLKPNTTYTINDCNIQINGTTTYAGVDHSRTFTTGENDYVSYVWIYFVANAAINRTFYPQIEEGSSATDWSPYSNICPISGHTEVNVVRTGKNLCPTTNWENGQYVDGVWQIWATRQTSPFIRITPNTDISISVDRDNTAGICFINYNYFDENKSWLGNRATNGDVSISGLNSHTLNISNPNACYLCVTVRSNPDGASLTTLDIPSIKPQVEFGSTATTYEPYAGQTYPISLGQTVYGGTLNVTTGVLTITDVNIASYAGETLPSTWICDRAVYVSGTTPPTGSQVVYKLATPTTVQLTAAEVETLFGQNNVWCSSGNVVKLTYRKAWEIALAEGE